MKLDKKVFKNIVKECLVEILAEGIYPQEGSSRDRKADLKESIQKKSIRGIHSGRTRETREARQSSRDYLDKVSYGSGSQQNSENNRSDRTSQLISKVTKDPIMSEIFADTAASTLKEQREGTGRTQTPTKPADTAARIVADSDPTDLFGASAGKWADLAFAPKINR